MNTDEMFLAILNRMDSIETDLTGLNGRMDRLETGLNGRMDKLKAGLDAKILKLEVDAIMELFLVRREIFERNKSLEKEIGAHNNKDDNSVIARDIEGSDKIYTCLKEIEKIYQELEEKVG